MAAPEGVLVGRAMSGISIVGVHLAVRAAATRCRRSARKLLGADATWGDDCDDGKADGDDDARPSSETAPSHPKV
ncbi:hypothetical protein [Streptomyces sp. I5]|uniref:hypothetical protein n=1 Tax=Streptomyces sp. I5 TaxID=2759947 RepID=UPI0018EE92D7|nr:hypothetical protein [Streptomyces sp. I5]MBJ6630520.1 hypothetical protein [Streptomyces sp. I5]